MCMMCVLLCDVLVLSNHYWRCRTVKTLCVDVFDSACPVHVSGWWDAL